jgi:F-type H+-transporting ATPase subunit epsilon
MLLIKIITPAGSIYEGEADCVTLPSAEGEITILPNHTPLVFQLLPGELVVKRSGAEEPFAISGGVGQVHPASSGQGTEIVVLTNSADRAEEIDFAEAEAARKRALEMLSRKEELSDVDFSRFQAVLDRELAKIRVGNKYQRR